MRRTDGRRVVIAGMVKAAGDQETVCELQARIPVGESGWLFWDDASRSRALPVKVGFAPDLPAGAGKLASR